jgi:hypothetical protein
VFVTGFDSAVTGDVFAIGSVFIARGLGAILGAISCAKFYAPPANGNSVMVVALGLLISLMVYTPFVTNTVILHFVFAGKVIVPNSII